MSAEITPLSVKLVQIHTRRVMTEGTKVILEQYASTNMSLYQFMRKLVKEEERTGSLNKDETFFVPPPRNPITKSSN